MSKDADKDYGLGVLTPVRCGGGRESGSANERKYLARLRCPNGKPVRFERKRSVSQGESAVGTLRDIRSEVGDDMIKTGKDAAAWMMLEALAGAMTSHVMIDEYDVQCACGKHRLKVYMNMYADGEDKPLGAPGWVLADHPAILKAVGEGGAAEIHIAAQDGNADLLRGLLAKTPGLVSVTDDEKRTSLHYAATNGHRSVA